jgi:16S rRNA (cytosine1402-N4)-methyltransferase
LQASIPYQHRPVLLAESIALLEPKPGDLVVDGTVGGGGHAAALLERIGPAGRLVGLDVDDEALLEAARRLGSPQDSRVTLVRASFRELGRVLKDLGIARIDRLLLDLGVSSRHLDAPERGFRFSEDSAEMTPLDMRMDRRNHATAADLLRTASAPELERIFREYGELEGAARLARALVAARRNSPLRSAGDLVAAVRQARVGGRRRHHPATLVFQALRIAVNDELRVLQEGLAAGIDALKPGGRLAVIAYHSLEDRAVKQRLRDEARGCVCPPRVPVCVCGRRPRLEILTPRPVTPQTEEIRLNPRSRSARLRAAERLDEAA